MNNNIFYMSGSHYGDVKKKNHNQYMMCLNLKEAVYFQTEFFLLFLSASVIIIFSDISRNDG